MVDDSCCASKNFTLQSDDMSDEKDVVVVGGGFAGLACARAAAAAGLDVLVLEKKHDVGASPHTTGILVGEVQDAWRFPASMLRPIRGVRLYSPSLRSVDLERPGYAFHATDTPAALRWLAEEAQSAGAEVRTGSAWDGSPLPCRVLVGADGPRSRVARRHGLGVNREFLVGVEAECEGVRGVDEDRLHCFLDSELAPGYLGWVVPGLGITQVGLACRAPRTPRLDAFVRRLSRLFDFSRARIVGRRGGLIPVGGAVSPFSAPGVLLIGDAAGLVSPLTAGGIAYALRSGDLAGEAIAAHLLDGGPGPADVLSTVLPRFRWKRLLRRAIDMRPPNRLLDALFATPPFLALARTVFFHHRGLFSRAAWADLCTAALPTA